MIGVFAGCSTKNHPVKKKSKMQMFQSVAMQKSTLLQEGKEKNFCPNCGMTLPMFYKTNHASTIDGKVKQYCSIHCVAEDILEGIDLHNIKVVDTNSLQFIDASNAFYVLGSKKKGTMTGISKYAFSNHKEALAFAKKHGGEVGNFEKALQIAKKDFTPEQKAKLKAKQMKMAQKGAKIYKMKCNNSTLPKFHSVAKAKAYIQEHRTCGALKGKGLQAVGIYLFTK